MNHRHLPPNEPGQPVDGAAAPGAAPLPAHLAEAAQCPAPAGELQRIADSVEGLPHFTPKLRFADGVMSQVRIHEPWYQPAVDSTKHLIPTSTPMRFIAGAGAVGAGVLVSGGLAWLAFRGDLADWVLNLFVDRTRQSLVAGAGQVAANALGADAANTLAAGGLATLLVTGLVFALSATGALVGFRRLAATSRAHRS